MPSGIGSVSLYTDMRSTSEPIQNMRSYGESVSRTSGCSRVSAPMNAGCSERKWAPWGIVCW